MDYRFRLLLRRYISEGDVNDAVEIANIAARSGISAEGETLWVMQVGDSSGTGTSQQSVFLYTSQELALENAVLLARHILDTAWSFGPNPAWGAQFTAAANQGDFARAMEVYTVNYPQSPIWIYEEGIDLD
jgi:hypothetical protein